MATIRLIPSTYYLSNNNLSISNASNIYTNTDSTTYATVNHNKEKTTSYYVYIRGFNFNDIPANATINSAIVKVKAKVKNASSSYAPALYDGTTSLDQELNDTIGTSTKTSTVDITSDWETYKGYGSNFGIRLRLNRSNKNTASSMNIYGAEILVDYTVPVYHTVSVTQSTGGTISLSQSGQVLEGTTINVTATPFNGYELENIYVNGNVLSGTSFVVDGNKIVSAIFNESPAHYVKVNGRWRKVLTAYRKVNGEWKEFNYIYDDSLQLKYLGHITSDIIGEVTSDYYIVITDTSVPNDTYYFYYENENKEKLADWDVIGSTEFNGYNGGTITTGEEVGTIESDNTITLTSASLASGDYTMYYEDADGTKLEGWDSIGTITK